jgi:hypothetical protein
VFYCCCHCCGGGGLLQAATSVKFHDGVNNIPINVMQGANKGENIWIGFSSGDLAILNIENKTLGTRWKAHQGGVSTIVAMLNSVWSGDHYVLALNI